MKEYIIDTNALISFVTDRNLAQQKVVAPLFAEASRSKCQVICPQSVLTEFVFVMDKVYGTPKTTINAMIGDFLAMPGVALYEEGNFKMVLSLWPEKVADFGDALVAATGNAIKGAIIVTFDEKFKSALKKLRLEFL